MNSLEFKNFKLYADSTLKSMNKDELISYIRRMMNEKADVAIQELVDEITSKKPIRIHKIKIELQYFDKSSAGLKPWELRLNDRDYKVGDILILREWDPKKKEFTGRILTRQITEMFKGLPYLPEDVVIMTIL